MARVVPGQLPNSFREEVKRGDVGGADGRGGPITPVNVSELHAQKAARAGAASLSDDEIDRLVKEREQARFTSDYKTADVLRDTLEKLRHDADHDGWLRSNEWLQWWLDEAGRVLGPDYEATPEDMLRLRRPTSGANELPASPEGLGVIDGSVGTRSFEIEWRMPLDNRTALFNLLFYRLEMVSAALAPGETACCVINKR